ncbi:MAG: hypothetical protein LBR35_02610, partial [Rickettsiales bacterium]|nr:hypothetical protein [Rickettsiales bacterium]
MNNFKYIWISDNGENSCDVCRALHNTKYESLLDVPEKPHPNCKCVIKEINRFSENILTPAPWSGRNAMKNMYGNPIYEKSNGTREIYPSKHPNGSQEEKDAQAWNEIIEEELISQMSEKIKDFEDNNIKQNPKNMNFSQKGIEFLKEKENKVTDKNGQHIIYDDATGKAILAEQDLPNGATIGYGHLIQKGEDFSKGLNEVEAIELLKKDIRNAENIVKACISVPIKQNEFDSLVSLA